MAGNKKTSLLSSASTALNQASANNVANQALKMFKGNRSNNAERDNQQQNSPNPNPAAKNVAQDKANEYAAYYNVPPVGNSFLTATNMLSQQEAEKQRLKTDFDKAHAFTGNISSWLDETPDIKNALAYQNLQQNYGTDKGPKEDHSKEIKDAIANNDFETALSLADEYGMSRPGLVQDAQLMTNILNQHHNAGRDLESADFNAVSDNLIKRALHPELVSDEELADYELTDEDYAKFYELGYAEDAYGQDYDTAYNRLIDYYTDPEMQRFFQRDSDWLYDQGYDTLGDIVRENGFTEGMTEDELREAAKAIIDAQIDLGDIYEAGHSDDENLKNWVTGNLNDQIYNQDLNFYYNDLNPYVYTQDQFNNFANAMANDPNLTSDDLSRWISSEILNPDQGINWDINGMGAWQSAGLDYDTLYKYFNAMNGGQALTDDEQMYIGNLFSRAAMMASMRDYADRAQRSMQSGGKVTVPDAYTVGNDLYGSLYSSFNENAPTSGVPAYEDYLAWNPDYTIPDIGDEASDVVLSGVMSGTDPTTLAYLLANGYGGNDRMGGTYSYGGVG